MNDRHPLMIALGMRLAKDRVDRTEDLAKKIDCATSTYRLAESGALILNPVLALKISQLFEYEYSALVLLLVAMHTTDSYKSTAEIKNKLETIGDAQSDDRLKHLLNNLGTDFWKAYETSNLEKFKSYLKENILDTIFYEYLKSPDFGKTVEQQSRIHASETEKLISSLPTLYYDHLDNFLNQLDQLPLRVRFSDLYKWEKNNLKSFRSLNALIKDENAIIHEDNLKSYKFEYLWEKDFHEANFIFLDVKRNIQKTLLKTFQDRMKKALKEKGDQERLEQFDKIFKRIKVKFLSSETVEVKQILTGINYDDTEHTAFEYDGFWIFQRREKKAVSFLATLTPSKTNSEYPVFGEGYSLNTEETDKKLELFNKLWNSIL